MKAIAELTTQAEMLGIRKFLDKIMESHAFDSGAIRTMMNIAEEFEKEYQELSGRMEDEQSD